MKKMMNKRTDQFDSEDHITELEILLSGKKKILILEGKSDRDFFKLLLSKSPNDIHPFCIGDQKSKDCKTDLIKLFEGYERIQNNDKVLGVIDKDLAAGYKFSFQNLLHTELHDLDCYYLYFSSFERFVVQLLDDDKLIDRIGFKPSEDIEKFLVYLERALAPLTKLRLINSKFKVPFNKILKKSPAVEREKRHTKFSRFINDDLFIDEEKLITCLFSSGLCSHVDGHELKKAYLGLKCTDIKYYSNGHDLISILTNIVNFGRKTKDKKTDLEVEEALRLVTDLNVFQEYPCTQKVMKWVFEVAPKKGSAA
ncbi:hypothetical protein COJ63_23290 [Bacillus cereus]|nr:hypothetical protein COJ63_23290 [Bacillus cereus]